MTLPEDPTQLPATEADLEAHLHATLARQLPRVGWSLVVLVVCWWPLDLFVWDDLETPRRLGIARAIAISMGLGVLATPPGRRLLSSHPLVVGVFVSVVLAGIFGAAVGPLGPAFLPFAYSVPLVSVGFFIELRVRFMFTFTLAIVAWASAYVSAPHLAYTPMWWSYTSFMVFLCLTSVMMGEVHQRLTRSDFFQQAELRRQRATLQELNRDLEDRVADQTAELRGLALRLQSTRDHERQWVAQELREATTRELEALRRSLTYARGRIDPAARVAVRSVDDSLGLVDQTAATIGRILDKLRPEADAELGLADSLQWLAEDLQRRSGVECSWENGLQNEPLPPAIVELAYKITQEGLANVGRHARARTALVRARREGDVLVVRVDDDGLGLPPEPRVAGPGGMAPLREQVLRLGGSLELGRSTLGGTMLEARLPLGAAAV
jgi:signal transduction histidine kinase